MKDKEPRLQPSIFSRLTDDDTAGTSWRRGYELDEMLTAVQSDLEDLLNTPRPYPGPPPAFELLRGSIACYGLPELVSRRGSTPDGQEELRTLLQETIARFEPRLKDVSAELVPGDDRPMQLRIRIKATLCIDPAPEVAFDTILELTTGRCSVKSPQ